MATWAPGVAYGPNWGNSMINRLTNGVALVCGVLLLAASLALALAGWSPGRGAVAALVVALVALLMAQWCAHPGEDIRLARDAHGARVAECGRCGRQFPIRRDTAGEAHDPAHRIGTPKLATPAGYAHGKALAGRAASERRDPVAKVARRVARRQAARRAHPQPAPAPRPRPVPMRAPRKAG